MDKKHNKTTNQYTDIYNIFGITEEKKALFSKMKNEWSILTETQEIKPYDINPINTNIKG